MKKLLLSATTIAAALALVGCLEGGKGGPFPTINKTPAGGGGGGFIVTPDAPAGKIDATLAGKLTGGAGDITAINELADPTKGPSGITAGGWAGYFSPPKAFTASDVNPFANCISYSGGDVDADEDDIPKKYSIKFDCKNVLNDSSAKISMTGGFSYEDENDSKPFPEAGYIMTYDDFAYKFSGDASPYYFANRLNGYFKYSQEGRTMKVDVEFENSVDTDAPKHENGVYGYYYHSSMTPDSGTNTKGRIEFNGFYKNTLNNDIVLEYSTKSLIYDHTCTNFYRSGSIVYEDGSNNKITYTYENCDQVVTLNGEVI